MCGVRRGGGSYGSGQQSLTAWILPPASVKADTPVRVSFSKTKSMMQIALDSSHTSIRICAAHEPGQVLNISR
jgi:hypothetical protein